MNPSEYFIEDWSKAIGKYCLSRTIGGCTRCLYSDTDKDFIKKLYFEISTGIIQSEQELFQVIYDRNKDKSILNWK